MKIAVFCFVIFIINNCFSQDPSFSQPNQNLTYLNPAFTGTSENMRVGASYRDQWPNISGNFITTNVYIDQYLGKWGGVGLTYIRDVASKTFYSDNLYLDYAYQLNIGENGVLSLGIELGYIQKRIDWGKLTFGNMINPRRGFIYPTPIPLISGRPVRNFDLGGGILYYNKYFFGSYSLHHINQPNISLTDGESKLPMLHSIYVGGVIKVGNVTISPQFDMKIQTSFQSILTLIKVNYKWITVGASYLNKDAFVGVLGVTFDKISINYSYDVTLSKLSATTRGAHEIGVKLFLNTLKNKNERFLRVY